MERWAKSVNIQKQVQQNLIQQMTRASAVENQTSTLEMISSKEDYNTPVQEVRQVKFLMFIVCL